MIPSFLHNPSIIINNRTDMMTKTNWIHSHDAVNDRNEWSSMLYLDIDCIWRKVQLNRNTDNYVYSIERICQIKVSNVIPMYRLSTGSYIHVHRFIYGSLIHRRLYKCIIYQNLSTLKT